MPDFFQIFLDEKKLRKAVSVITLEQLKEGVLKLEDVIKDVDKALRGLEIKDLTQSLKTGNKQEVEIGAVKGGRSWDS